MEEVNRVLPNQHFHWLQHRSTDGSNLVLVRRSPQGSGLESIDDQGEERQQEKRGGMKTEEGGIE
ncbi:hypothetical protein BPOR_0296g00040 [Botrytis porri]|uniref:Uncharacterized protein n=1 Tax=Botrytis porri TaxID=87229 RepID=A0A4Z1KKC6_9HELO|nr:hypothetical protein BPOR_0296g00040 [Botrytis porri]